MADKLILTIYVDINPEDISELHTPVGDGSMIPFSGTAEGEIFHGIVRPGGVDTQRVNLAGARHMSARYMLKGTDSAGEPCQIFVDNNGWYVGRVPMPFQTVPTLWTDSKVLAPYLHQNKFRGEGHPRRMGVEIRIFEVDTEEK